MLKIDKYEFEEIKGKDIKLFEVHEGLIYGRVGSFARSWFINGTAFQGDLFLNPIDKFKDLRRVFEEGAIIHFGSDNVTVTSLKDFENNLEAFDRFYIKGQISIKSWDENKEFIKKYWEGAKIEDYAFGAWAVPDKLTWNYSKSRYRVKLKDYEKFRDIIKLYDGKHCCWVHEYGGYFAYCHKDGRPLVRTGHSKHTCRTWSTVGEGILLDNGLDGKSDEC